MSKPNPNYYAIIPANVRYDNDLTPNAKLLYGEITALANTTGYCTANNKYFATLYDVKPRAVTDWISSLQKKGYIEIILLAEQNNKRAISIVTPEANHHTPPSEKSPYPLVKNHQHNNTSKNNTSAELRTALSQLHGLYLVYFRIGKEKYKNIATEDKPVALAEAAKKYQLTPIRKEKILIRLKDKRTDFKTIQQAIIGYGLSDWHNGNSEKGWKADLTEFICRSYEQIEKGVRLFEQQKQNNNDPYANL